uniref:Helically-extended SH3 domain-containing protein n=1 Tax=Neogobius melanostomus TaxID=47308 RepID=A0A8C6WQC3_9GOBI
MEEETSINFKALRAKFQEEALMAESRASRPTVAGKPKHLPPQEATAALWSAAFTWLDGLRTSGGRRPISFPPHPQRYPNPQTADGDAPSWHSFKDRHMPLVLPVLPKEYKAGQGLGKEQKLEMDNLLQTITKKKNMLLPFKSSRPAKNGTEHGEEPTYADLTCRPASAPGELPSVVRINTDDRALLQGSENVSESTISSLDITISPPSAETHTDSESRVFSTLEKAKKKFSRRHVMSPKPKCSSPEKGSKGKAQASPTKSTRSSHSTDLLVPPPIPSAPNLPNFLYISARPFCKGSNQLVQQTIINITLLFVLKSNNISCSKECQSPYAFKDQKKREKQRLEREKKELKEREKKENEMKKKFKVTGNEEPLYHAKVTVASKVRKNDLPVKSGDTISIIRTTNCPKGKWLARDANHKYGHVSVMNVELNIKEMLELGKKAQAAGRGGNIEADTIIKLMCLCSVTDDSEEWACEDETLSPSIESM